MTSPIFLLLRPSIITSLILVASVEAIKINQLDSNKQADFTRKQISNQSATFIRDSMTMTQDTYDLIG